MLRLPADPALLRYELGDFGFNLADSYLRSLRQLTVAAPLVDDVLLSHVTGIVSVSSRHVVLPQAHQEHVQAVRLHTANEWHATDTARLARTLRPYDSHLADAYADQAEQRQGRIRKWGRRLSPRRPSDGLRPEKG